MATLPEIRGVIHGRVTGELGPLYNASTWIELEVRGTEIAITLDYDRSKHTSVGLISRYRLEGGRAKFLQRTHIDRSGAWYRERQPDSLPVIGATLLIGSALTGWWVVRHKGRVNVNEQTPDP